MTAAADPFVVAVRALATIHRETKVLLEASAKRVANRIKKNIDQGMNAAGPYYAEGAPRMSGPMTPLSKATLGIRKEKGRTSTRPFFETGHTYNHIGGWLGDVTQIRVGGTDKKARNCILLNYGTGSVPVGEMAAVREALDSVMPNTDIPSRNPIGYTQKDADTIFDFWHKAFLVGNKTHSRSEINIRIF